MSMKNPPHPGKVVRVSCLESRGLNVTAGAKMLGVSRQALSNLVNGRARMSTAMAARLAKSFGSTTETWIRLQTAYDVAQTRAREDKIEVALRSATSGRTIAKKSTLLKGKGTYIMDHTHIIRATDLEDYANTRESEAVIPELINRLVKASAPNLTECRIPYGEAVNQSGWDGHVQTGEPFYEFVPGGDSYWEIGTGANPQKKATDDFRNRTPTFSGANPQKKATDDFTPLSDADRAKATFVFVTPRSRGWDESKQRKWINDRKESGWKDIRIIDGVKLADWLREFPSLGKWMAKKIHNLPREGGLTTPREHWELIVGQDKTSLPPTLFTAGRSSACEALESVFTGKTQKVQLFAESENDAKDFVAAYLASLEDEKGRAYTDRCLFISDEEAWRSIVEVRQRHVLVASPRLGLDAAENMDLQTVATNKGHAVIIPHCSALPGDTSGIIALRSPSREQIEMILREAGYAPLRTRELAEVGGDRLSAIRRHLVGPGTLPPYASWPSARQLARAGLVGKWDGTDKDDKAVIEELLGKDYEEWLESLREDVLRPDAPLMQRDEKWRLVARGEAWSALGRHITDGDLDRLQETSVTVLGERDPQFDLPKEKRHAASLYEKQPKYSARLREGLVETLALIGSKSEALSFCSQDKAETTAILVVRGLLEDANWERWASLNPHLPLLAEAAPDEFLDAVESALGDLDQTPFHEIFSQEGGNVIGGGNYMTGLLWALETLAWSPEHLSRVAVILADLASIDPGGSWGNRPANSLADIFLPWHIQTTASFEKRQAAIKAVLREQPAVGWELLLHLLPQNHAATTGCRQPTWRDYIPRDWKDEVSRREYWEQITAYADLLGGLAQESTEKLRELIEHLPNLPIPAHESLLNGLGSQGIVNLPESVRLPLWENLDKLVRQHRKFADAQWALPEEALLKIEEVAHALAPEAPELKYQHLFTHRESDLSDEKGDYGEQRERLNEKRRIAVQAILSGGRLKDVLAFAQNVAVPHQVGEALGVIASEELEAELLPTLLDATEETEKQVVAGFVWARHRKWEWPWVDAVLQREWTKAQQAQFLALLPFEEEVWHRVADQLGEQDEGQYWRNVMVSPYGADRDLTIAIEKLLACHRASEAVRCVSRTVNDDNRFDEPLATRALLAVLEESSDIRHLDQHETVEVITRLQKSSTADRDALFKIEWNFLPWLNQFSSGSPSTLEQRLASDSAFFAEAVRLVYRSTKDDQDDDQPDERRKNLATNAYRLLTDWRWYPGRLVDGSFDVDTFKTWLGEARRLTEETGHKDVAQIQIGQVLTHVPSDPNGLWIHEGVAEALNGRDTQEMRSGFTTELFNQRGGFTFTAGEEERELAQQYRTMGEDLEERGFSRFATAMRELANQYERDANRAANRRSLLDD